MFCPRVKRISMTQTRVKRSDGAKLRYDLVAKFSKQGTRWALATFSWDNFAGEFYRAEIVKTFDTLQEASTWLSSERERAAVENPAEKVLGNNLPDPVEEIVAELQMASNGAKSKLDRGIGRGADRSYTQPWHGAMKWTGSFPRI